MARRTEHCEFRLPARNGGPCAGGGSIPRLVGSNCARSPGISGRHPGPALQASTAPRHEAHRLCARGGDTGGGGEQATLPCDQARVRVGRCRRCKQPEHGRSSSRAASGRTCLGCSTRSGHICDRAVFLGTRIGARETRSSARLRGGVYRRSHGAAEEPGRRGARGCATPRRGCQRCVRMCR
jgi:hypothetical protein